MSVGKQVMMMHRLLREEKKRLSSQILLVSKRTISKAKETSEGHEGFSFSCCLSF